MVTLWDLPEDKVYVKIKEDIRSEFFRYIKTKFGGEKKLSKLLNTYLTRSHIFNWKIGKQYCPLKILNSFLYIFEEKDKIRYKKVILFNVEKLKAGSKSISISNIKFPIKFSPNLARIAGHLVGDGGVSDTGEDKYRVYYTNKCKKLVKAFNADIKKTFGNIEIYDFFDKRCNTINIKLPKIVGIILVQFFGFQANNLKHIPEIVFKSNNPNKSLFLQALFDDEANIHIQGRKITIMMTNRKIIEDTKTLLQDFGIETSKVKKMKKDKGNRKSIYGFYITDQNNLLRFHKEIGFSHTDKREKLKLLIGNYQPHYKPGELDKHIFDLLKTQKMTTFELSVKLERSYFRIKQKLRELEKEGLIESTVAKQNLKIYHL